MSSSAPVGIFDSGIGGLSIAREIRNLCPDENLVYVADSRYTPYGEKSEEQVLQRCLAVTEFLIGQGSKAIVVACNTATAACIQQLRARYDVPFIGIEPGVKPAAVDTQSGVIGVLATSGTLSSHSFETLSGRFASGVEVKVMPAPELVMQVESLKLDFKQSAHAVEQYIAPLIENGVDTILLGCTHFAHLAEVIQKLSGPDVKIVRIERPVADELLRQLESQKLTSPSGGRGYDAFWTSGSIELFERQVHTLWDDLVKVSQWSESD